MFYSWVWYWFCRLLGFVVIFSIIVATHARLDECKSLANFSFFSSSKQMAVTRKGATFTRLVKLTKRARLSASVRKHVTRYSHLPISSWKKAEYIFFPFLANSFLILKCAARTVSPTVTNVSSRKPLAKNSNLLSRLPSEIAVPFFHRSLWNIAPISNPYLTRLKLKYERDSFFFCVQIFVRTCVAATGPGVRMVSASVRNTAVPHRRRRLSAPATDRPMRANATCRKLLVRKE